VPHVVDHFQNHPNQIASFVKDPKEIEELKPHEERSDGQNGSGCCLVKSAFKYLDQYYHVNTNWGDNINVVPD